MPPSARYLSRGSSKGLGSTCKWSDHYKWLATWPAASVRNKLFGEFARSQPAEGGPRPEWPRLSFLGLVRSGSRSDSFRGPGRAECTEMHYSPGNLTRKGAGLPLLLLLFTLASRPLLRYPGPGLSFRGIAPGVEPDPLRLDRRGRLSCLRQRWHHRRHKRQAWRSGRPST